ncbi:hypothetical protein [Pelagibaculum spongiae]|uniref:Peptidase n=1 Tax=Pelagibaculum spongiae TaxID=2080658 RepID=A0A2V1H7L1_9GAMM|nr:hypothetical protein [Pelagibaculum spongiae]PVZ72472.1 hypothetical protein DC094_05570 [Pelagibaculum spongiae]
MNPSSLARLQRGDILLMSDASSTFNHFAIAFGQALMTHNRGSSKLTHVGIYDGQGGIIEASGQAGLRIASLASKAGLKYKVFRLIGESYQATCEMAADIAAQLCQRRAANPDLLVDQGFGRFAKKKSISSVFRLSFMSTKAQMHLESLKQDPTIDRGFYCSNLVTESYNLACLYEEQDLLFNVDTRIVSPKKIHSQIKSDANNNWQYVGKFVVEEDTLDWSN